MMINRQILSIRPDHQMTLAAVAKCLQAVTWLVARGNKQPAVNFGSGRNIK